LALCVFYVLDPELTIFCEVSLPYLLELKMLCFSTNDVLIAYYGPPSALTASIVPGTFAFIPAHNSLGGGRYGLFGFLFSRWTFFLPA
jgi:hypothetical protein